jgi:hypothetical protein
MFRVTVSAIPLGEKFKRFWLPSLDSIDESIRALQTAADRTAEVDFERIVKLIRHTRIGGTNKSSAQGRLREADAALLKELQGYSARRLNFLDIGCSEGTASIDTIELIQRQLSIRVSAFLQDRYIWVSRRKRWNIVEYVSTEDDLVMVRCGRVALAPVSDAFFLASLTNRLVSAYLGFAGFRRGMQEISRFPLLSPAALNHADTHIREGSILTINDEFVGRMHVVRVSNLLHSDYFSEGELRAALINVVRYLREGGLLLLSRNHRHGASEIERGTVWRLADKTLSPRADFGGGSELKEIVSTIRV